MFREMRRIQQEVPAEICQQILNEEKRGVLSLVGDGGYPYGIPMNFYFDEADNKIYFHCAKVGHKIDALQNCAKVCFTTWNRGFQEEGDWAWNVTSVIVFGKAELVKDRESLMEKLRRLALKYYPSQQEVEQEIRISAEHVEMISLEIEHMTGKLVNEK